MDVTIVGCSGSFAGPRSPASSYLVRTEHEGRTWSIVLDLGNGALGALQRHIEPYAVDAVLLSKLADTTLLVAGVGVSGAADIATATDRLRTVRSEVLGAVVSRAPKASPAPAAPVVPFA